jgi:uncharacterized NAD(P)/FAD-binding protein YdhS
VIIAIDYYTAAPESMNNHDTVKQQLSCDVAIIGGGFSGVTLSIQLIRLCQSALSIVVVDRSSRPGRGLAYSTLCCDHLLNVRVKGMSALAGQLDHFNDWINESHNGNVAPDTFVPRGLYGEYLEHTLRSTLESNPRCQLTYLTGNAVSLSCEDNGFGVLLETGTRLRSTVVVLAMGNARPSDPLHGKNIAKHLYADYAWDEHALDGIPADGEVLLLGSGLTAVDQVLGLKAQGFRGTVTMVSRRGKLPGVHCSSSAWAVEWGKALLTTVSLATREVRRQIDVASQSDVDWRCVIDSLRPWTSAIWKKWPLQERQRFLRHVRPYWEASRHRLPPATNQMILELMTAGVLRVLAGRVIDVVPQETKVDVTILLRGAREKARLSTHRIINCTGSGTSDRVQEPFIEKLIETGLASYDPLRIGIATDDHGRVIGPSGELSANLYALGPLRKATLWETTAVPEIREQALKLAERITSQWSENSVQ